MSSRWNARGAGTASNTALTEGACQVYQYGAGGWSAGLVKRSSLARVSGLLVSPNTP